MAPLESLTNPEAPIKINRLNLESPERTEELPFDPERDVTKEDWEGMTNWLAMYLKEEDWDNFAEKASHMAVLDRRRILALVTAKAWTGMEQYLHRRRRPFSWEVVVHAAHMAVLDAERVKRLLTPDDWKIIKEQTDKTRMKQHAEFFTEEVAAMAVLDVDEAKKFVTTEDWERIVEGLEEIQRDSGWFGFAVHVANIATLDPGRAKVLLTPESWEGMREELENARFNVIWSEVIELSACMTRLARLYQQPKNTFNKPIPPLPERRNF